MPTEVKELVRNTIKAYLQTKETERENLINYVKNKLEEHEFTKNENKFTQASRIFLRIYKRL
jgi:hypothetical protein